MHTKSHVHVHFVKQNNFPPKFHLLCGLCKIEIFDLFQIFGHFSVQSVQLREIGE